jgi:hypothetical protein
MSNRDDRQDGRTGTRLREWFGGVKAPPAPPTLRAFANQIGRGEGRRVSQVTSPAMGWRLAAGSPLAATVVAVMLVAGGVLIVAGQRGPTGPSESPPVAPTASFPSSSRTSSPPSPTPPVRSAVPAKATSVWTPATLPHVSSTSAFGGPAGGISALPGGGFIDFVPERSTRSLVFTSPDGSHWTQAGVVDGEDAFGITGPVARSGRTFVALGSESGGVHYGMQQNGAAWISTDLLTWTKAPVQNAFAGTGWRSIAGGPAGFVATGYSEAEGGSPAWYSSDGLHWATVAGARPSVNDTVEATGVSYADGGFVMVGRLNNDAASWTSVDGRRWAIHAPQPGGSNVTLEGLVNTASGFLSLGTLAEEAEGTGHTYPIVAPWTSRDGVSWNASTASPALADAYVTSLVAAPGGYVATGTNDVTQTGLWTSRDGLDWVAVAGVDLVGMDQSWIVSDGQHVLLWASGPNSKAAFVTSAVDR